MQRIYEEEFKKLKENEHNFVIKCLDKIVEVCDKSNGEVAFGNTRIIVKTDTLCGEKKRVPFVSIGFDNDRFVPLYSYEGYTETYDIAHWADIVEDWYNSEQAGNDKYSQDWNLKK